jgi:cytochrome c553
MRRTLSWLLLGALLVPISLQAQAPRPQPAPIAETRLLMEGLTLPNFKGIDRLLRQKPKDNDDWTFLRGQALLIAETGNLLLMRPPRNGGETAWQNHAADLRAAADRMARAAAARDYEQSKVRLAELATMCNRCHQTFRVPIRMPPKEEPKRAET